MKTDFYLLTKAEEAKHCTNCRLPECVTPQDKRCPARIADRHKRSTYRIRHNAAQRKLKAEGRGYWPDKSEKLK